MPSPGHSGPLREHLQARAALVVALVASAETQVARATATTEAFEARLRRVEAQGEGQARK